MGYMKIPNLYKDRDILLFKQCYALEKIHGTSAHLSWNNGDVHFFSGGENHDRFVELFDKELLICKFMLGGYDDITIYGEAYGGKQQGMSKTYGSKLKFIVFDVKFGEHMFVNVPVAHGIADQLGLEFVDYQIIDTDIDLLNQWRDLPSAQAVRNGIIEERPREGVVLRPLIEVRKNNGARIIAKHKAESFQETKTTRNLTQEGLDILTEANAIADEWVTEMRLTHVLQKFTDDVGIESTGDVIKALLTDIEIEAAGEIDFHREARKQVSKRAADMFKRRVSAI
jgi:hypothetical protein